MIEDEREKFEKSMMIPIKREKKFAIEFEAKEEDAKIAMSALVEMKNIYRVNLKRQ